MWDQPVLCLHPSYQSWHDFLFLLLVIGVLSSQSSDGLWGWFFNNLVAMLIWSGGGKHSIYLLCYLDQNKNYNFCNHTNQIAIWDALEIDGPKILGSVLEERVFKENIVISIHYFSRSLYLELRLGSKVIFFMFLFWWKINICIVWIIWPIKMPIFKGQWRSKTIV